MDWKLYDKYGERNEDGYYIDDHKKWHKYAQNKRLYRRKKYQAYMCLLIPVAGIILMSLIFEEMGLSIF